MKHVYVDECFVLVCASEFSKYGQHIRRGIQSSNGSACQKTKIHFTSVHTRTIFVSQTQSFLVTITSFLVAEKLTSSLISTVKLRN